MGINIRRPVFIQRESILDRRIWVYYLIIVDQIAQKFGDLLKARPDDRFYEVFGKHVEAYVKEGKMPPTAIEAPVLNAADDYLAGRDITLRAGDYIAVQNYLRSERKA
jgi:hypothetical protein